MRRELIQTPDVTATAVQLFVDSMRLAVLQRDRFVVVLSGGSTPLKMYEVLKEIPDLPWDKTHVFWGDERFVPHDDPDSNYGAAHDALLKHVSVPERQIHPWAYEQGEGGLERARAAYAKTLQDSLSTFQSFDLTFLGLGDDAHTASLFPGTGAVFADGLTVSLPDAKEQPRLSFTPEAISHSRIAAFLVSGENKREALQATLENSGELDTYPARSVTARERVLWVSDVLR